MTTYTTQTADLTITRDDEEIVVTVTGDCYPDEGGEVENISATLVGVAFELTSEEEEAAASLLADKEAAGGYGYDY